MIGTLKTIVFDAPDIAGLSAFYARLAGWTTTYADEEWVTMITDDGWQQAHLDLRVPDIDAAATRAVDLGAALLRKNETWHTLADPAGHPFDLCLRVDDPDTTLMGVMLDCPDAGALATFYSELLGKPVTYEGEGAAMIGEDGAQPVLFQQVESYTPPRWPDPAYPQQLHLDVQVTDVDAAERAALAIGARRLPGEGENWRVYADPVDKPFCFVWDVA
jgi:predicted enzyme related to lactoylglutathione lyase